MESARIGGGSVKTSIQPQYFDVVNERYFICGSALSNLRVTDRVQVNNVILQNSGTRYNKVIIQGMCFMCRNCGPWFQGLLLVL